MPLHERKDPLSRETLFTGRAACGLTVQAVPRAAFSRGCAQLTLDYGAVDRRFTPRGSSRAVSVPAGTAHFLEHKMFEKERGDLFDEFSSIGASANAMTGHLTTSYTFSTADHFQECLDTLLELVFEPHFTDALVEKEFGIIDEEIRGYDDSAGWRAYRGVLEGLYRRHPVRDDIAGTSETIRRLDAAMLRAVHDAFYVPANAVLCVAGAVDPAEVVARVDERMGRASDRRRRAATPAVEEPDAVRRRSARIEMPIAMPILYMGFKGPPARSGLHGFRLETSASMMLDLLLGETSELHEEFYAEGLIGDDFSWHVQSDRSMSYVLVGGQTPDPRELERRTLAALDGGLSGRRTSPDVERVQRRVLGDHVRLLDSMEALCGHLADCHRSRLDPFALPDLVADMSTTLIRKHAREMLDPQRVSRVTVTPPR